MCAPNIQQNESQINIDRTNRFPDEYEIRDIPDGLKRVGSRVTRTFTLSVYSPEDKDMPVYISGRRKNTVNGILYKNDPAILAWQLGNEFGSYPGDRGLKYEEWSPKILAWSLEMDAYIKKADQNHLVMEAGGADRSKLIADPNIEIISDHLYEYWNRMSGRPWVLSPLALESYNQCKGKKPLIIDEFGLGSTENLRELMKTIRESNIAGGLMWSIRSHRRDGGWYYHNEGGTPVSSFHIPGFSAGFGNDEIKILELLRKEALIN